MIISISERARVPRSRHRLRDRARAVQHERDLRLAGVPPRRCCLHAYTGQQREGGRKWMDDARS